MKLFKKQPKRPTATNQGKLIKRAFEIDGHDFYQYENLIDMPYMRYLKMLQFSTEVQMRIDASTLDQSLDRMEQALEKGKGTEIAMLIGVLKEKLNLLISPDAVYRLLSCVFFYKDEYLDDYDFEIGDKKIDIFKRENIADFFLHESAKQFIPETNLSSDVLEAFSQHEKELNTILSRLLNSKTGVSTSR